MVDPFKERSPQVGGIQQNVLRWEACLSTAAHSVWPSTMTSRAPVSSMICAICAATPGVAMLPCALQTAKEHFSRAAFLARLHSHTTQPLGLLNNLAISLGLLQVARQVWMPPSFRGFPPGFSSRCPAPGVPSLCQLRGRCCAPQQRDVVRAASKGLGQRDITVCAC